MQEIKNTSTYRDALKEKILDAAMTAFSEKGIKAVKMDDIANSLSISKRTLYEIYGNKEDLLFEGVKKYNMMKQEEMRTFSSGNVNVMDVILHSFKMKINEIKFTNPTFYSDLMKYPRIMRYFDEDKKYNQCVIHDFMHRGIEEGYFRKDVNYELVICMIDAQHRYIMTNQLYQKYSMKDIFFNFIFVSLRGICTSIGVKELDKFLLSSKV